MGQRLCDIQWREILDLAETAADIPQEVRSTFLAQRHLNRRAMTLTMELAAEFHLEAEIDTGTSIACQAGRMRRRWSGHWEASSANT